MNKEKKAIINSKLADCRLNLQATHVLLKHKLKQDLQYDLFLVLAKLHEAVSSLEAAFRQTL